jgi:hypothetical protein
MDDQLPLPGPKKAFCPCGCGLFGTPTKNGHIRLCKGPPDAPCYMCRGRRNRTQGKKKQRVARKALGIPGLSLGVDEEELWRGAVRVEVKSGKADTGPVDTRYRKSRAQSDASRAYGDNRPFAAITMPPGMSDGYATVRLSEVVEFAYAVIEQYEAEK